MKQLYKEIGIVAIFIGSGIAWSCYILMKDQKSRQQEIVIEDKVVDFDEKKDVIIQEFLPVHIADEQEEKSEKILSEKVTELTKFNDTQHQKNQLNFFTMPVDQIEFNRDLYETLAMLVGPDVEKFVAIILQSNNNLVSTESCRSCSINALFAGVFRQEKLSQEDLLIMQSLLKNLVQFLKTMKKLAPSEQILSDKQLLALQSLEQPVSVKNNIKLQARKAATAGALKKLQTIAYNR